ncbi:hypothetical protein H4R19_006869, partial [Coemansia spiralis]
RQLQQAAGRGQPAAERRGRRPAPAAGPSAATECADVRAGWALSGAASTRGAHCPLQYTASRGRGWRPGGRSVRGFRRLDGRVPDTRDPRVQDGRSRRAPPPPPHAQADRPHTLAAGGAALAGCTQAAGAIAGPGVACGWRGQQRFAAQGLPLAVRAAAQL